MPQIYDMGPTALLPLRRKACWGFFRFKNPTASAGFEPTNLGTKGSTLPLDHRSRTSILQYKNFRASFMGVSLQDADFSKTEWAWRLSSGKYLLFIFWYQWGKSWHFTYLIDDHIIQIGDRNNFVIYPCTHYIYTICEMDLLKTHFGST